VTITVCTVTSDDIGPVIDSVAALFATDGGRNDPDATNLDWARQEGHSYYSALIASDEDLVLVARDGEDVAGHLIGRLRGPTTVHPIRVADLESIHVYPGHRGQGVGAQLVATFLTWATAKGAQRATVTAYAANEGAQRFYARHGFAPRSVTLDRDVPPPG
jgi:GNAT superfamily N-acetyltransferase